MTDTIRVGYGRVDISPLESVPLSGYGNNHMRMSQGVLDPLFATCIAFTDSRDETLLLYTMDALLTPLPLYREVCRILGEKHGVDEASVIICATHTHSGPDCYIPQRPSSERYRNQLINSLVDAAELALADRAPATMEISRTETKDLNFVRHYLMADGTYAGDNFGDRRSCPIVRSITEPDRQMQLLRIHCAGKPDILMVNWQAHPALASTSTSEYGQQHRPFVTSDYVGPCRELVEQRAGVRFAFFQGACGNINSRSYIPTDNVTKNHREYGQQVAEFILAGLADPTPVSGAQVDAATEVFHGEVDHTEDHLLPKALEILAVWEKENDAKKCAEMGRPFGINSTYHAGSIRLRAGMGTHLDMNPVAARVGDIGFAAIPYEPFDTNGVQIKEGSPFAMTFVLGYANGYFQYVPSKLGFDYSCYERNQCKHVRGTGEAVAETLVRMLHDLHK